MDRNQDEWRVIPEFPAYMVNRLGDVRNTQTGRIMKGMPSAASVILRKGGKTYNRGVRPLMRSAFPGEY